MADLTYKTRGDSSPQGKPKVYLACHPEDSTVFDTIADEILTVVNCAVFYAADPITDLDEHRARLREMNLVVIPITETFLTTPSMARDVEFPLTQEHHIPVLPLMQESGLVDLFNRVCGDIQFLDKNATDTTAISYEEKFTQFLTSILVGDELAEEIRSAFDAYIFLSYRKKDREYAKELMRLIHENDFCRDVAIWYDEFLTPGENFNDMIADALNKSALFALAVTPNLVNETNYVMTTEYPMAQKAGKPILAAEIVPTDRATLETHYNGIPENVDAHNVKHLSDALINAFQWIMLRDNDDDPRHNYLIGLAYLSGIDVEKNPERAREMITFAAEAGLPDAIKKLVTMYQNAEGVERDFATAIRWQEKLVEISRTQYEQTPSEDTAGDFLFALDGLHSCYLTVANYTKARALLEEALSFMNALPDWASENFLDRNRASCYSKLGELASRIGNSDAAQEYFEQSNTYASRVQTRIAKEAESIRNFSVNWLADAMNNPEFASLPEEIWNEMKNIFLSSSEEYTFSSRFELAQSHVSLGSTAYDAHDYEAASEHFGKALELLTALIEQNDSAEYRRELAIVHSYLGDIAKQQDRLAEAYEAYMSSYRLLLGLKSETENGEALHDLAAILSRMATLQERVGQKEAALALQQEALMLNRAYAEKNATVTAYETLAASFITIAMLYRDLGAIKEARQHAEVALSIWNELLSLRQEISPLAENCRRITEELLQSLPDDT
ncbi:MAG: TIR domain-containing protein [Clostridia bacterium]|nr:TIR domain-containing protein [Clostridia bacterium]